MSSSRWRIGALNSSTMNAKEFRNFLVNKTWKVRRRIRDPQSESSFLGEASFIKEKSIWIYRETGDLQYRGQILPVKRNYLYVFCEDILAVQFSDSRPFYTISHQKLPSASYQHICGADTYSGHISIGDLSWKTKWNIVGPQKNLRISTSYR